MICVKCKNAESTHCIHIPPIYIIKNNTHQFQIHITPLNEMDHEHTENLNIGKYSVVCRRCMNALKYSTS